MGKAREVVDIFRSELPDSAPVPNETQVKRLAFWLEQLAVEDPRMLAAIGRLKAEETSIAALHRTINRSGFDIREAFRTTRGDVSDRDWALMLKLNPLHAELHRVLEDLGSQLDQAEAPKPSRGAPQKPHERRIAVAMSNEINTVFVDIGIKDRFPPTSRSSLVARIGSAILSRYLGYSINPQAFADRLRQARS